MRPAASAACASTGTPSSPMCCRKAISASATTAGSGRHPTRSPSSRPLSSWRARGPNRYRSLPALPQRPLAHRADAAPHTRPPGSAAHRHRPCPTLTRCHVPLSPYRSRRDPLPCRARHPMAVSQSLATLRGDARGADPPTCHPPSLPCRTLFDSGICLCAHATPAFQSPYPDPPAAVQSNEVYLTPSVSCPHPGLALSVR